MTSDAKIGLLLGLVFIFVIAFIINGLPNLKPQQATRADVPVVVGFDREEVGVAGATQVVADRNGSPATDPQQPASVAQTTTEQQPSPVVAQTPSPESQVAGSQDVRYETLLPGTQGAPTRTDSPLPRIDDPLARIENLLKRFTADQQTQTTSTANLDVPAAPELPAAAQMQQPKPEVRPVEPVARTAEQPSTAVPAKAVVVAKPIVGKIYTVGEGENLSTVAKNVYGPEEGNRYVNIIRIYEANKDVVKSMHEVVAGQKLIIPPLPKPTINPNKPSDVLSKELFDKVETISKRPVSQPQTQTQTPTPAAAEGRWYTVQDGDNLWKIASAQLGAGARYDEIAKLNTGLLQDDQKLKVGVKIRLPLK
jgi:nucleoid-associated protein YgaU